MEFSFNFIWLKMVIKQEGNRRYTPRILQNKRIENKQTINKSKDE